MQLIKWNVNKGAYDVKLKKKSGLASSIKFYVINYKENL